MTSIEIIKGKMTDKGNPYASILKHEDINSPPKVIGIVYFL